jgi:hypothetical protein
MAIQVGFTSPPRGTTVAGRSRPRRTLGTNERIVVMRKTVRYAAAIAASAVLTSSAVAQANPATPMSKIESSAAQLCGAINGNPTKDGVIDGVNSLDNRGLDDLDGALVLISAMHHVCPQHEVLMMSVLDPIAVDEICNKA